MPAITHYPLPFYITCVLLAIAASHTWSKRREAWGIPATTVLFTVFFWYVGDVLYNDFGEYSLRIGDEAIENAWWQVCCFVIAFVLLAPRMSRRIAGPRHPSFAVMILEHRPLDHPSVQAKIDSFTKPLMIAWCLLMVVAVVRVKFNVLGLFAPYLTYRVDPWSRNRMGGGIDSLLALGGYFQIFLTAGFGVIFAVARNRKTRQIAFLICFLSMPYYIFARTRNSMLATIIPGFSAWVFGRVRGGLPLKMFYIAAGLMVTSLWFSFVLANRTKHTISDAFQSGASIRETATSRHLGLNMFEELSWINLFIENGLYQPNWGMRYFAEAVNPIPRIIWPGKPSIGIDYAIARGQAGGSASNAGVFATISTGMIGQGVVNFGPWLGPIATAYLMAIWVGLLARHDRIANQHPARILLYALGLILTFNMGRDITLLSLYPFIFGWILIAYWERRQQRAQPNLARNQAYPTDR